MYYGRWSFQILRVVYQYTLILYLDDIAISDLVCLKVSPPRHTNEESESFARVFLLVFTFELTISTISLLPLNLYVPYGFLTTQDLDV